MQWFVVKVYLKRATAQRAVRERVKFPELVEQKYVETLVVFGFFIFFNTYCNIEGWLLVKYFMLAPSHFEEVGILI